MFAPVHRSVLTVVVFASVGSACAGRLEDVIRAQAAGDLSCPEGQVTVQGRSAGGDVRNYAVSACGRERSYQAACNSLGTCVAYPVGQDAGPSGREDLWADQRESEVAAPEPGPSVSASVVEETAEPGSAEPAVTAPLVGAGAVSGEARAVTLRNECERTVALFIGEDPATGAGRYTSLGSMNTATLRLRAGEPVWLLDAKGAGLTSIAAGGAEEIAVLEGCGGFVAR